MLLKCFVIITCLKHKRTTRVLLCYYKRNWLLLTEKWDLPKAGIFKNVFRLIDDLCTFNNNEFESNFKDI